MRILILYLIFIPLLSFSQNTDNWITPFANIEFKDGLVYYQHAISQADPLIPQFVITEVYLPQVATGRMFDHEVYLESQKFIIDIVHGMNIYKGYNNEKIFYLKAFALLCIWGIDDALPSPVALEAVWDLCNDPDSKISETAIIVKNLYNRIVSELQNQKRTISYFDEEEIQKTANNPTAGYFPVSFSPPETWPKYYGEPNRNDYSRDIMETYDKGYIICGGYNDFAWLIKTDINGNILWEKILECDGINYLNAIHQTMDGGILVCGAKKYSSSNTMPYLVKLNACGEKLWCKSFYTPEELPWAQDIKETNNGDIIMLVNQYGNFPEETMHLFKLNAEGDVLWKKPYCSGYVHTEAAIPKGRSLNITSQNDYLINGYVYWEDPWNPGGPKGLRPLFAIVDSIGNEKWVLPFGLNDTLIGQANNAIEISGDLLIGVGRYADIETGIDRKGLVMMFDINGNALDYNIIDFNQINEDFDVGLFWDILPIDSVYILASYFGNQQWSNTAPPGEIIFDTADFFTSSTFLNYNHYVGNREPYNVRLTNASKLLSNSVFDQPSNWDIALSKLNLDMEYDTAYPGNYTYDSLCTTPGQPQSGFIYLDDCEIITGIDIPSPEEYYAHMQTIHLTVYPNPSSDRVNFAMENTEHHQNITLKCYNILGNQIFETPVTTGQKETVTLVSNWPQGMYVAVVYRDGLPVGQCKFVVK